MDRERTDAVWKKYGRSLWNFAGSYGLGIALMLILLVLTFAGTLHQVRLSSAMGSEAAIESFFGAAYVLRICQPAMMCTRMTPSADLSAAMNSSIVVCMFSVAAVIVTGATPLVGMLW